MKTLVCIAMVFVAAPAFAQTPDRIDSGIARFEPVEPPEILTWTVATNDGRSVSLAMSLRGNSGGITFIDYTVPGDWDDPGTNGIDGGNAGGYGADWNAWKAALADTAYTRSIFEFANERHEFPLVRHHDAEFKLSHILFSINNYWWPNWVNTKIDASFQAWEARIVPEPATWLLAVIGGAAITRWRKRHG